MSAGGTRAIARPVLEQIRKIGGKDGRFVGKIGLGTMGLTSFYGNRGTEQDHLKMLNKAVDRGCTLWNSADIYQNNHKLLGKFFKSLPSPNRIFISDKIGFVFRPEDVKQFNCKPWTVNGSNEYLHHAIDKSLKEFDISCIDLLIMNRMDKTRPIEQVVTALAEIVKMGKAKYIGLSECSAQTLRRAHAVHPITAIEVEYSPWSIDIEQNGVLDTCRELNVNILAYSPLGRGFLAGKFKSPADFAKDDIRRMAPRFKGENFTKNLKIVDRFKEIAKEVGCTPSQLCLSWIMAQDDLIIPIPGTTKLENLEENLDAVDIVLTKEQLASIRKAVDDVGGAAGTRATAAEMGSLFQ